MEMTGSVCRQINNSYICQQYATTMHNFSTAYFILTDRGLGVVSLNSYQHGGHRIRVSNCVLEGKVSICAYQNSEISMLVEFSLLVTVFLLIPTRY